MRLHIGNLPKTISDREFNDLFSSYGPTTSVELVRNERGELRGYGFAEFTDADHARAAIAGLHGKDVAGQPLSVAEARPRKKDGAAKPVVAQP